METLFSIKERAARFRRDVDTHAQEWLGCHYAGDGAYVFPRVGSPRGGGFSRGGFQQLGPGGMPHGTAGGFRHLGRGPGGDSGIRLLQVRCRLPGGEEPVLKSDPYAYHFETRPANASKVYHLGGLRVGGDAAWKKKSGLTL